MTTSSALHFLRRAFTPSGRLVLAFLAVPAAAASAHAGEKAASAGAPVLAEWSWWFWLGYFSNAGSRGNVITLCVAILCLSLLILMSATRRN